MEQEKDICRGKSGAGESEADEGIESPGQVVGKSEPASDVKKAVAACCDGAGGDGKEKAAAESVESVTESMRAATIGTEAEHSQQEQQEEQQDVKEVVQVFCCMKCRCLLFTEKQLSEEEHEGRHRFSRRKRQKEAAARAAGSSVIAKSIGVDVVCTSLFVSEPPKWLADSTINQASGKLLCPKCKYRVGSFSFSGSQCSCGSWIVPAYQFPESKVDPRMWYVDQLPPHVLGEFNEEQEQGQEQDAGEEEPTQVEDPEPKDERLVKHMEWLQRTIDGDVSVLDEMVHNDEPSFTTVQKKAFDGKINVTKALSKSLNKLKGRIKIENGPAALPNNSPSTRVIFSVEGIDGLFGENIYWCEKDEASQEKLAQHIIRKRNPGQDYLVGGA